MGGGKRPLLWIRRNIADYIVMIKQGLGKNSAFVIESPWIVLFFFSDQSYFDGLNQKKKEMITLNPSGDDC